MFKGMGQGFSQVVMLVVGGSLFTSAIQTLELLIYYGICRSIKFSRNCHDLNFQRCNDPFGILSGGGLAMFYAVIELIPGIAEKLGLMAS